MPLAPAERAEEQEERKMSPGKRRERRPLERHGGPGFIAVGKYGNAQLSVTGSAANRTVLPCLCFSGTAAD